MSNHQLDGGGLDEFKAVARVFRKELSRSLPAVSTAFRMAPHLEGVVRATVERKKRSIHDALSDFARLCDQLPAQEKLLAEVQMTEQLLPIIFGYKTAVADRLLKLRGLSPQAEF